MNSLPDNSVVISVAAPVKYMSSSVFSIASHLDPNTQSLLDIL